MAELIQYIATYNPLGIAQLRAGGFRPPGTQFVFWENDEKSAIKFFRRYIRNLFKVVLTDEAFSIYEPRAPFDRLSTHNRVTK